MINRQISNYIKGLASSSNFINGNFHRKNIERILFEKKGTDLCYPFLSLEKVEFGFKSAGDKLEKIRTLAICIVAEKKRNDGESEEIALLDVLEDEVDFLISKIKKDIEDGVVLPSIIGLKPETISVVQIPFDATSGDIGFRIVLEIIQRYTNK